MDIVRAVPVEFLTDEQAAAYGTFAEVPMRSELERFFYLDDVDRDLIALRRTQSHQLGFALQLCTVRYVGLFLEDPLDVPWPVVEYPAEQLRIDDPSCIKAYTARRQTLYDHAWEIRRAYGYRVYENREAGRKFRAFLHGRAWIHAEGPVALFDHAVGWLRRHRVLWPGVQVLARQVSEVRAVAERRLHATVAGAVRVPTRRYRTNWWPCCRFPRASGGRIWSVCGGRRPGPRERGWPKRWSGWRRFPRSGWAGEAGACAAESAVGAGPHGSGSKTPNLARASEPKRTAMVCAIVRHLEAIAIDDALDLFVLLMAIKLINPAWRATDKERLAMLPRLERASRMLARASRVLIEQLHLVEETETDLDVAALWNAVESVASRGMRCARRWSRSKRSSARRSTTVTAGCVRA